MSRRGGFFWVEKRKLDQNTERGHFRRHRVVQVSERSRRSWPVHRRPAMGRRGRPGTGRRVEPTCRRRRPGPGGRPV